MIKKYHNPILLLAFLGMLFVQQARAIDEIEPNNSLETAQQVTLPITISGNADSKDEGTLKNGFYKINDLFTFTLPNSSTINAHLHVENNTSKDSVNLLLFNSDGTYVIYIGSTKEGGSTSERYIDKPLQAGTYFLGVNIPSGSTSYSLNVETSPIPQETPLVSLSGAFIKLLYRPSNFKQVVYGVNFSFPSKCKILSSDESFARISPRSFLLSSVKDKQVIKLTIPRTTIQKFLNNVDISNQIFDINVICENGANDKRTLILYAYDNIDELFEAFGMFNKNCQGCADLKQGK